jgi:phenylacetate-coenzyme A ligase PaaK-like adenylate-forming protein
MTFYRHTEREKFDNPLPSPCRIAVVAPNFQERDGVRTFEENQFPEIEKFRPEILAGTVHVLLRLAEIIRVPRALVAFSGARLGPLSPRDRDLLWSAYQVPVFEQSLSPEGAVIARECEAHDGLHLYLPEHYRGAVQTQPCPCGRPEPRIAPI